MLKKQKYSKNLRRKPQLVLAQGPFYSKKSPRPTAATSTVRKLTLSCGILLISDYMSIVTSVLISPRMNLVLVIRQP